MDAYALFNRGSLMHSRGSRSFLFEGRASGRVQRLESSIVVVIEVNPRRNQTS